MLPQDDDARVMSGGRSGAEGQVWGPDGTVVA